MAKKVNPNKKCEKFHSFGWEKTRGLLKAQIIIDNFHFKFRSCFEWTFHKLKFILKRSFNQKLGEALSAQEEHSKNYDRLLAAQTSNYTTEIKTIANMADNLKNNELRFQKVAEKIVALQE